MKKKYVLIFIVLYCLLPFAYCLSQTNPKPFNLTTGNYSFTTWEPSASAGTYPPNMLFQWVDTNYTAAFYNNGNADYQCIYSDSAHPRFNGLGAFGISVITTSKSNTCQVLQATKEFTGCILLSLNSLERNNIQVSWKSQTVTANPREMKLRLQYRVDTTSLFTDVPGPIEFTSSQSTTDSTEIGPVTLPAICNNQAYLELRWIYFENDNPIPATGKRCRIRLGNILVSSQAMSIPPTNYTISGHVYYDYSSNYELNNINVILKTSEGIFIDSVKTNNTGQYSFTNINNGAYILEATSKNAPLIFAGPTDALLVNRYYIHSYSFATTLALLAAQVNADGTINPFDALLINRKYIGVIKSFKAGNWVFQSFNITVQGSNVIQNIKGRCVGDVQYF